VSTHSDQMPSSKQSCPSKDPVFSAPIDQKVGQKIGIISKMGMMDLEANLSNTKKGEHINGKHAHRSSVVLLGFGPLFGNENHFHNKQKKRREL
jgi:hypothetical protein